MGHAACSLQSPKNLGWTAPAQGLKLRSCHVRLVLGRELAAQSQRGVVVNAAHAGMAARLSSRNGPGEDGAHPLGVQDAAQRQSCNVERSAPVLHDANHLWAIIGRCSKLCQRENGKHSSTHSTRCPPAPRAAARLPHAVDEVCHII